jgi:asparagine synthase (glutamine-hydrolysing)
MCGILGRFCFERQYPDATVWRRLVALLRHRGPDAGTFWCDGRFAFGHRRLSIIDLAQGGQPMATEDGAVVACYNGEIYNYIELRDELTARGHRFRTKSDTEVLLHGYREWGTRLPEKLRGMFAFALADRPHQQLFAVRDRFGEKPFFYAEDGSGVSFASELKVLAAIPDRRNEVDERALGAYLCLNYVPGDSTLMRGIRRLPPASWRRWSASGAVESGRYWQLPGPESSENVRSLPPAVERMEALLDDSTRLALRSDVPVGLFLSGGIDSSLVAASAARSGSLARAYCLTFDEASYSEWPAAHETARHLNVPLEEVRLSPDALGDFLDIVRHADDPLADSSALAVWTLSRRVSRDLKVVLSGDGGDELFGGYLTYPATLVQRAVATVLPHALRETLARAGAAIPTSERKVSRSYKVRRFVRAIDLPPAVAHFTWNGTWLPAEAACLARSAEARDAALHALALIVRSHEVPDRPTLADLQRADLVEYLPNDILAKSDRMSMAHGLEVRAPFLDPEIAAFALRLPSSFKVAANGRTKWILRELARQRYGIRTASRPKQGFSIPIHAWLRGRARYLVDDLLSTRSVTATSLLDSAYVSQAVDDHMSGRRSYGFELWGLAVLVAWHRTFIASRSPLPEGARPDIVTFESGREASASPNAAPDWSTEG